MSDYYLFNGNPVTLAYPAGGVFPYIGSTAPVGYILCDGASYNRFTYAELFNIIGYTYGGSGDNFNVPDYRDRSLYGGASGSWGVSWNNASTSYNRTITMPTHTHNFSSNQFSFDNNSVTGQASGTYFTHQHLYPWNYDATNTNTNQAKYINSSLITWGREFTGYAYSSKNSPHTHYTENSGYDTANHHFNPCFYEWGGSPSAGLDAESLWKTDQNTDGSTVSAGGGGSNSVTQLNTAPHETRVNYIMNYGTLSNISNVVNIYSSDNSNYTEYTSGGVTYAMFDMTSTESYFYMEYDSSVSDDLKSYLEGNFGAQLLIVGGGGAGGGTSTYLGGGGGAGGLGYSTTFNLPAEKTIYARIGKAGVDGTTYSETHETTFTGQEGKGGDTVLYIDGSIAAYVDGGGSGQDDYNDTSTRWGGSAGGYSGTYTAQGSSNLSLSGSESSMGTNYGVSTYGIFTFLGNTNGASSDGYWSSYPSFWWRGGTGGGGAGGAGISHAGPYDATTRGANGTNGGAAYTWIDSLEYAGGGGGGGNGVGGGGGGGDGGAIASSVASSTALLDSGADGQTTTIANRGSGGGGGFTGGSGSDGVVKIAIPKDYILSVTQIPVGSLEIFTTHQGDPGISFGGSYLTSYNGIPYTFFYFTDAQAETTTGTTGGGQANQNNKFFIGTDPTLTPEQTKAISKIHGVEILLIGGGGSGGMPGFNNVSDQQGTGSGGGGAGGMGELHNGNLPTNQYIKFLIGQEGDTTGIYSSDSGVVSRGYYFAGGGETIRRDTRVRASVMQIGTTESNVSTKVTSYMGGYGGGTWNGSYSSGGTGGSAGGSTHTAGAIDDIGGGVDSTSGTYGAWNFYGNSGGSGNNLGIAGGGGGAGGAGYGSGSGLGGDGRTWIDGNTYCTGGGGNGGSDYQISNTMDSTSNRSGGSSSIHGNSSGNLRWSVYRNNPTTDQQGGSGSGAANSGAGGGGRVSYNVTAVTHNSINFGSWDNPGISGEGGSGLAVIAIPTALIKSIDTYDTYNTVGAILDIKYTGYDSSVTESTTTYNSVDYTVFELTTSEAPYTGVILPTYNFDFRQVSSTSITDNIGGLSATYYGGMSSTVANGASADGSDDYIQLQSFEFGGTFSIEIYFQYTANPSDWTRVFQTANSGTSDNTTFGLTEYINTSYLSAFSFGTTYDVNTLLTSATISTNVWRHMVITMDNQTLNVYQDGSLISTDTTVNSQTVGTRDSFYLFTGEPTATKMQGNIKFFRYWHGTELTSTDVTTLYDNREDASQFELTTTEPQHLSIELKSGIKALEKYALLGGGFDIPFLAVGGGSSGAALSGTSAVGDGGSGGAVVYGTFTWDASFTTTNIFEFVCGVGAAGGATTSSTRNAGRDTTIDLSGNYGLERYIDASGGEIDGSVGLGTSTTLTTYGNTNVNTSSSITFNSDYTSGTATGSAVGGAGGAGAGGAGSANSSAVGGNGGTGVAWIIDGANYGPGGGGAGSSGGGSGGNIIGGNGADANPSGVSEEGAATSGTANRGGGGGGGVTTGAAGTAGVVKFAIPTSYINSIGMHENTLQTSNYLKVQTSSGSPTTANYNGVDYYLFDFQTDDNLTDKTHYFKITWADDASTATRTANAGNYGSASNLMLMVGGGGAGGDGGMPHDTNDDPENWRLLVGGGGGAGGMGEVYDADIQIDELVSITVGGGGEGGLDSSSKFVCNKGSDSIIYYTSTEVARAKGGGVGNGRHEYAGGSGGGKTGGFSYANIITLYGQTDGRSQYYGNGGWNGIKTTDSIGTSISTYGNWTFYGNEGYEADANDTNNYIAYYGGSGGGSAYEVGKSGAVGKGSYGGAARQWAVDGSYYAAGGGGVVHPSTSHLENVTRRGNGGGIPGDNKETRAYADIYGGSGKLAVYYSYNKYGQNTETAWYFTGYPTKHQTGTYAGNNTSDYQHLFQNTLQWDGTTGTGSGGGGGVDWDVEALALQEGSTNSDVTNLTLYPNSTGLNQRFIDNGYAGSGGSGRVKIAIPKQINGVTLIPVANIETGYTGT